MRTFQRRPHLRFDLFVAGMLLVSSSLGQNAGLIRVGAEVELVADGFGFLEGPVRAFDGSLYFTDIDNNRIHRLSTNGSISVALEPSNHANGLTLDVDGSVLICEQSGQRITRLQSRSSTVAIVSSYEGQPFNSPNDIWLHRNGGFFFTDPRYRYPEGEPTQPGEYVYWVSPDRSDVMAIITDVPKPNGIIGTEDGAHLFVASTELRKVFRYDINPDFTVSNRIEFADQGSDGMTMDERGNVYLTWAGKVSIYTPAGELIEEIEVPQNPANVAFGGSDGRTLYMTARTGLYSVQMNVVSSRFAYSMLDRLN
jgi:gluconolactonase